MREELEKRFFKFVRGEPSGRTCALESVYAVHKRRRKALAHFLLVVCGPQYREGLFEETVIDAATDGVDWHNSGAGFDGRWEEALRRGWQVWRLPPWVVRSARRRRRHDHEHHNLVVLPELPQSQSFARGRLTSPLRN